MLLLLLRRRRRVLRDCDLRSPKRYTRDGYAHGYPAHIDPLILLTSHARE
jgi:hypothetical protein